MQPKRYLPEVTRNRAVTNWVVISRLEPERRIRSKRHVLLFAAPFFVLTLLAVIGIALPNAPSVLPTRQSASPTARESTLASAIGKLTHETAACSEADIIANIKTFARVPQLTLGGVRYTKVHCGVPPQIFVVVEHLVGAKWQIQKISRPPEGDREISVEY